ncbi:unnamed protein product [Ostreobium quekettii]|uniref:C2 domain-containing protein n=2 Tax=Ostreobium quekettii TaxID=121088 RepID=A0A8S1JIZ7_9CHLO|nr:unnamed protein product [Ostreobium quekettii]
MGNSASRVGDKGGRLGSLDDELVQRDGREGANAVAALTGAEDYSVWVELRVSCRKLQNRDVTSLSDPMAVLFKRAQTGMWEEVGRTEVVANNLNPVFIKSFSILYQFEHIQRMKLCIYDVDSVGDPARIALRNQDFLGQAEFALSEVVSNSQGKKELSLVNTGRRMSGKSMVVVQYEEQSKLSDEVTLSISASGILSKKKPPSTVLVVSKAQEGGAWQPVARSEVQHNTDAPRWRHLKVSLRNLCNGDMERPLKLEVFSFRSSGSRTVLGEAQASLMELQDLSDGGTLTLGRQKKKKSALTGELHVDGVFITSRPSFLDYIASGFEISFLVAVDFTISNGRPTNRASLHYLDPMGRYPTPYEEAIQGVGEVLEFYDSDRLFPTWGFGGMLPTGVSHCFALNGNDMWPECAGVEGIRSYYRKALMEVGLAAPTLFAPVIGAAMHCAKRDVGKAKYYCLLILTDGIIKDMEDTVRAIVAASSLPLSILIVGIGTADFSKMEALDSDRRLLEADGRKAQRDIVQFVEFNRFKGRGEALAAELLEELPGQFLAYMRYHNMEPLTELQRRDAEGPTPTV